MIIFLDVLTGLGLELRAGGARIDREEVCGIVFGRVVFCEGGVFGTL
jgi:hypothetical protein